MSPSAATKDEDTTGKRRLLFEYRLDLGAEPDEVG
jgi:hypothetical protein